MKTPLNIEKALWDYIDGIANPAEKLFAEKMLATDPQWQQVYQELLSLETMLQQTIELEEPSLRFSKNVMDAISRHQVAPATKSYLNKKIIYGIGGFFLVVISGLLLYVIGQTDWSTGVKGSNLLPFKLPALDPESIFSTSYINAFLLINILLGLLLTDHLLRRRKTSSIKEQA